MKVDFLIVGQGLAGSLLAWQLLRRRKRVLVVDRDEAVTSSKVAAGLVTPVHGARFRTIPGLDRILPAAKQFYWDVEETAGKTLFRHLRIARIFASAEEKERWERRCETSPEVASYGHPLEFDESLVRAPHGGFEMSGGGWLHLPDFLEATRQHLLERAALAIARVDSREIHVSEREVRWKNVEADCVVFCQGWRGDRNRFFDWIPMNPCKGEILDLRSLGLAEEKRILNSGGWVLPLGEGRFRAGATYDHEFDDLNPTEQGRREIEEKISRLVRTPLEVTGHRAALRPTIRQSHVVMGRHPTLERVAFFNGLGSRGVLNGPSRAAQLVEHLLDGAPLESAVDLNQNYILA